MGSPITPPPPEPRPLHHARRLLSHSRKLRVLVLSSDTGGGHRASAAALRAALSALHPAEIHVDVVDFWVELAAGPFRLFPQQYTFLARHPALWSFTYHATRFPPFRAVTECYFNTLAHRKVRLAFIKYQPDLVVSVHPLVNTLALNVLNNLAADSYVPRPPYVTVVTDLGGAHPTWFHRNADMVYVPVPEVARLAQRVGMSQAQVTTIGLPVRQQFWEGEISKAQLRKKLCMHPDAPAVLVIGGGDGVGGLKAIATMLARQLPSKLANNPPQIVVICGKNQALRESLCAQSWNCHMIPLGYVSNVSEWMAASDIICTKAGPGTIAESLIRGLPIIITAFLPGQEEANVRYVEAQKVGVYASKPAKIASIAAEWLSNPQLLREMSARAESCGRPQATVQIAQDILRVARLKITDNIAEMERRRQVREATAALARSNLRKYLPNMPILKDDSKQSHLLLRVRFLMRVLAGSLIAQRAFSSPETSPSSSMDRIPTIRAADSTWGGK
eukprot:gb/GEZJ01002299.1/.p2 GENE.gb/GEZJ01002299.1/~~gb/GEZJ01002299.1/.p2  ORF type:complete len:504 (-),score=72.38 gb/GEZJ01002299.1/:3209-4720(-)